MKMKVIDRRFDQQMQRPESVTAKMAARWSDEQRSAFEQGHPDVWAIIEPIVQSLERRNRSTDTDTTE